MLVKPATLRSTQSEAACTSLLVVPPSRPFAESPTSFGCSCGSCRSLARAVQKFVRRVVRHGDTVERGKGIAVASSFLPRPLALDDRPSSPLRTLSHLESFPATTARPTQCPPLPAPLSSPPRARPPAAPSRGLRPTAAPATTPLLRCVPSSPALHPDRDLTLVPTQPGAAAAAPNSSHLVSGLLGGGVVLGGL